MTPSPAVALLLLGVWVLVVFAATNAAAYAQWRATDETNAAGFDALAGDETRAFESPSVPEADRSESAADGVHPVADD